MATEEYTLEERMAYALYSKERVRGLVSLEERNEQIHEVNRNFRRLLSSHEAQDFLELLDKCGLTVALKQSI